MEARLKAQCNLDLTEDGTSKSEHILKGRHNPYLGVDEEAGRLAALLDGIANAEVKLDRLEAAKCQTCQKNPGVCMKLDKHRGRCTGAPKNSEFTEKSAKRVSETRASV
jgi:hypothetical protein